MAKYLVKQDQETIATLVNLFSNDNSVCYTCYSAGHIIASEVLRVLDIGIAMAANPDFKKELTDIKNKIIN